MALAAIGAMALSKGGDAKNAILVAVERPSGPQASAQARHALLAAEGRPVTMMRAGSKGTQTVRSHRQGQP
jgi:hypothetical protein